MCGRGADDGDVAGGRRSHPISVLLKFAGKADRDYRSPELSPPISIGETVDTMGGTTAPAVLYLPIPKYTKLYLLRRTTMGVSEPLQRLSQRNSFRGLRAFILYCLLCNRFFSPIYERILGIESLIGIYNFI